MSLFAEPGPVEADPVGGAMSVALMAIFNLRERDNHAARRIASKYEEIAAQHTRGLLDERDTIAALARLIDEIGSFCEESSARTA